MTRVPHPFVLGKTCRKQYAWSLRMIAEGRCRTCGKPREHYAQQCDSCRIRERDRQRAPGGKSWQPGMSGKPPKVYRPPVEVTTHG